MDLDKEDKSTLQDLAIVGIVLNVFGLLTNGLSLSILYGKDVGFKSNLLVLIRHQTIVDMVSCVIGLLMMSKPGIWMTSNTTFNFALCHVWHTQLLYWIVFIVSVYNVTLISIDRFYCICYPMKYLTWTASKSSRILICLYLLAVIPNIPTTMAMTYENKTCINKNVLTGVELDIYQYFYSIYYGVAVFVIPVITWIVTYGYILYTLFKRSQNKVLGNAEMISNASVEILKGAVAVTLLFLLFAGYDVITYVMSSLGVCGVKYSIFSLSQIIGVLLVFCFSATNPFIYVIFVKKFRKRIINKLICIIVPCCKSYGTFATKSRSYELSNM